LKKLVTWLGLGVLLAAMIIMSSCSSTTTDTTTTTTTTTTTVAQTPAGPVVLTVTSGSKTKSYSMADLQAMKSVTGNGGTKNKKGVVTGPIPYKGVALIDLLNAVGGVASGQIVKFTGTDGYTSTVSYDQITSGGFTMYDASGNPATPTAKPTLAIVYFANGAALDSSTGPLEVGLLSSESLVSGGSIWAKLLSKIDVVAAP
jgi:DMSO/TMAO reductase YedYZ molybdopterin-dependent catalytic subunit